MQTLRFMLALCTASVAAHADDIMLTDGRTLMDAKIVKHTPMHVTVRHAGGLSQIEKRTLPESLRAQYPVDEAAATRERSDYEARRAAAAIEREAKSKALREQRDADIAARAAEESRAKKDGTSALKAAQAKAEAGAEKYFRTQWKPGSNEVFVNDCAVRINLIEPNADEVGAFNFTGETWLGYYLALSRGEKGSRRVEFQGRLDKDGVASITEK